MIEMLLKNIFMNVKQIHDFLYIFRNSSWIRSALVYYLVHFTAFLGVKLFIGIMLINKKNL